MESLRFVGVTVVQRENQIARVGAERAPQRIRHMPSIHDHAAIGDGRSIALVARDGTIDWLCWPVFDAPAVFAALLDAERGGFWRIAPQDIVRTKRCYRRDSNVLETTFECSDGELVLTDAMTIADDHRLANNHELLRRVRCTRGSVRIEMVFAPRPRFGEAHVPLHKTAGLGVRCEDGARLYALHGEREIELRGDDTATSAFVLRAGESAVFSLTFDEDVATLPLLGAHADERLAATERWWQEWLRQMTYDGPYRDEVARSILAIKLLAYAPSGAVVAAATTSLPELVGGTSNWDYRFCWLRDASFTARAFYELGFHDDGVAFCAWVLHTTRLTRPELRILYDVYGRPPANEEELRALAGYRGSRPVRINNAAADQLQLDCYGEVIDAATWLHGKDGLDRETQRMLSDLGKFVLANWRKPDRGIWEYRGEPQHRTHSRVLCWVALDRLLQLRQRGLVRRLDADMLAQTRDAIQADVIAHGWNPAVRSYTEVFGSTEVDASSLLLPWYGFEAATSPRMVATYDRIVERLRAAKGLYWRNEQEVRRGEGAFGICSAWVVDYLARAGRIAEARAEFDAFLACANDVGLLAEEVDIQSREALGNFPQAYTHIGVVSGALVLSRAADRSIALGGAA
jgi:GH15 family glucan-1,4-alpha-glucosidase